MEPVTREQIWFAQMFLSAFATTVPLFAWALLAESSTEHVPKLLWASLACVVVGSCIGYLAPAPSGPTRLGSTSLGAASLTAGGTGYLTARLITPFTVAAFLLALQVIGAAAGIWLVRHRRMLVKDDPT